MATHAQLDVTDSRLSATDTDRWMVRAALLWAKRVLLLRVFVVALAGGICIALLIPKEYKATARIMPPDQGSSNSSLISLLSSRSSGAGPLGALLGGLFGPRTSTALFINLLESGTVTGHLVERFQLQSVYRKRYRVDAAKRLERNTSISDDKKSGVITITVIDRSPKRARDLAQGYLDELNLLVRQTSNSAARQERIFLEQRLRTATADLEHSQRALSDYSEKNNTVDLKEQTRAMVDAGARVEGELALEQSTLNSVRQVYGDGNIRVREAEARIASLQRVLKRVSGSPSDASAPATAQGQEDTALYPPLRRLPGLAVPYADLYRTVRVQETIFELLTQQYESARIEEAKDIPAVNVIDPPGIPEKKSFPPRTLFVLLFTFVAIFAAAAGVVFAERWNSLPPNDSRKVLMHDVAATLLQRKAWTESGGAA